MRPGKQVTSVADAKADLARAKAAKCAHEDAHLFAIEGGHRVPVWRLPDDPRKLAIGKLNTEVNLARRRLMLTNLERLTKLAAQGCVR